MCGIAGFLTREPDASADAVLRRMTGVMAHRGPDGEGCWIDGPVALGHRRLSIIDVAAGAQPMADAEQRYQLVYNGEIYNHAELRKQLERSGRRYRTHCDTETILHAYAERGPACVDGFSGMFAFALWDRQSETLFCARDRLGIKPFYYSWDGRNFVFGSEIKVLLEHPAVGVRFDQSLLAEHLAFGFSSDDRTLFGGVRKLMPGHTLTVRPGAAPEVCQYWDIPIPEQFELQTDAEWIEDCRERFEQSVESHLMADVPLGMFLSGGVDSGSVAAVIKRLTNQPVKTFSVGYAEAEYSELALAAQVAEKIGTDHREITVSARQFFEALPRLIWHEDEPIAWPSSVSLHHVSKLAAEDVKVVLTGEGSDELFAGYARYRFYMLNQKAAGTYGLLPRSLRKGIRRFVATSPLLKAGLRRKLQHTFLGRELGFESLYIDNFHSAFSPQEQALLLTSAERRADPVYDSFIAHWRATEGKPLLSRLLYSDLKTYLVELLMKQDQMSMSTSIESRVPFLDHSFVEFAAGVPDHMKLRKGVGKYIFKKVAEDLIPHDVIYRPKMGFPTPLRRWLREDFAAPVFGLLRKRDGLLAELLDREMLDILIEGQTAGAVDATDRLWRLLNLQIWGEVYLKGRGPLDWDELVADAR